MGLPSVERRSALADSRPYAGARLASSRECPPLVRRANLAVNLVPIATFGLQPHHMINLHRFEPLPRVLRAAFIERLHLSHAMVDRGNISAPNLFMPRPAE